jgi:hypothetical protein
MSVLKRDIRLVNKADKENERQWDKMIAEGKSSSEIAKYFGMSTPEVERELEKIDVEETKYKHFANGGIVTKPTLALVGEKGAEAIVPIKVPHYAPKATGLGLSVGMIEAKDERSGKKIEQKITSPKRKTDIREILKKEAGEWKKVGGDVRGIAGALKRSYVKTPAEVEREATEKKLKAEKEIAKINLELEEKRPEVEKLQLQLEKKELERQKKELEEQVGTPSGEARKLARRSWELGQELIETGRERMQQEEDEDEMFQIPSPAEIIEGITSDIEEGSVEPSFPRERVVRTTKIPKLTKTERKIMRLQNKITLAEKQKEFTEAEMARKEVESRFKASERERKKYARQTKPKEAGVLKDIAVVTTAIRRPIVRSMQG